MSSSSSSSTATTPSQAAGGYDLRDVWRPPSYSDASKLTVALTGCTTCGELLAIVQAHQGGGLNAIHLSAALNRTARLCRQPGGGALRPADARLVGAQLVPLLCAELRAARAQLQLHPRAVASAMHALGALDVRDRELFSELAALAEPHLGDLTCQGLSNTVWALVRSGVVQPPARWMARFVVCCSAKLHLFGAQDLAMVMWALAKLKYRLAAPKQQEFLEAARRLMRPDTPPQALSMMAYSAVTMGLDPGREWVEALYRAMLGVPGGSSGGDAAAAAAAEGGEAQQQQQQRRQQRHGGGGAKGLARFCPHSLSTTLWSISRLVQQQQQQHSHPPQQHQQHHHAAPATASAPAGAEPVAAAAAAAAAQGQLTYAAGGSLPSELVDALNAPHALARRVGRLNAMDFATLTGALARLGVRVRPPLAHALLGHLEACVFDLPPSHLANIGLALAQITGAGGVNGAASGGGHPQLRRAGQQRQQREQQPRLPVRLVVKYATATYTKLSAFNPRDLSVLVQALARLGCQLPGSYLAALQRRVQQLGSDFSPQDIALTVWALQRLGASPTQGLMLEFFAATDRRLSSFKPQELSMMIWALAQVGPCAVRPHASVSKRVVGEGAGAGKERD